MVGDHNNGFGQDNRAIAKSQKPLKSRSSGWNTNFFSILDCFAVPCNILEQISTFINSAYTIIYSNRKYLLEFDSNFIASIKTYYGENAVTIDEQKEEITIITNSDTITVKYIPVKSILESKIFQMNVTETAYIFH